MTFKPSINPLSKQILNSSRLTSNKGENSIFENLYEDAFKTKNIENSTEKSMTGIPDQKRVNEFVSRMQHSVQKKREKERNQIFYSKMLEVGEGTNWFRPKICRAPKIEV